MRIISDEDVTPIKVIATHGHYDHVLAAGELKLAYQIPFLMHKADEFLLKRMRVSAAHFSQISADPPPKVDEYLEEGFKIQITNHQSLITFPTPGHTPGSISLYAKEANLVFVGDVIFAGGLVGRTDFDYSSLRDLQKSIEKLLKLPAATTVYSGHGEETTIKAARKVFAH